MGRETAQKSGEKSLVMSLVKEDGRNNVKMHSLNRDGAEFHIFIFIQFFCGVSSRRGKKFNR